VGGLSPTHPFLDHPGPIPFAHRGGAEVHPENTMEAFAAAVALGYRYLETDVHVTTDGVLVAFHDDRLDRVTDRQGLVADLPWSEVKAARVAGREPIVAFEDLLATFPEARINVDPKHDAAVAPLIRLLRDARVAERLCIGSFSDRRVAEIRREIGTAACTALAPWEITALRLGSWGLRPLLERLRRRPGRCVQIPVRGNGVTLVEPRLIAAAHELNLPVHVWTINDGIEMSRLLDLGVDGLFSDVPGALRDVLASRGEWHGTAPAGRPGA
jgi:glycerophosphoryl diester phosphodiesterase